MSARGPAVACVVAVTVAISGCAELQQHRNAAIGGVAGCAAGYAACMAAKGDDATCAAACLVGATVGIAIGAHLDERRRQLEQAAQAAAVPISITPVAVIAAPTDPSGASPAAASSASRGKPPSGTTQPASGSSADHNGLLAEVNVAEMFPSGSSRLTSQAAAKWQTIAKAYAQRTDRTGRNVDTRILVTGHTDSTGGAQLNQRLSEARAKAVAAIFAANGVPAQALYLRGAGSAEPIADNASAEGRTQNRRVEILEIDNEANLVSYAVARRQDRANLAYSTAVATTASARSLSGKPKSPSSAVSPRPTDPSKSAPGKQRSTSPPASRDYGFGGQPAQSRQDDVIRAVGPPPKHFAWRFSVISEAQAEEPISACYTDQPRVDGPVLRYTDGGAIEAHATKEYLPGMFGGGWSGLVGRSRVGFGPVAVLRSGAQPLGNPAVLVQAVGERSPEKFAGTVNTYEGQHGVLYRVYLNDDAAPLKCFDVALPKQGKFEANAGWIFYRHDGRWMQSAFRPALVGGGS